MNVHAQSFQVIVGKKGKISPNDMGPVIIINTVIPECLIGHR